MALQVSWIEPSTQVMAPNAYAKVIGIQVDAIQQTVDVTVGLFVSQVAYNLNAVPFSMFHFQPAYATLLGQTVDVRAACYTYMLQLPQFAGAISV
jgi:hypothetical protein